MKTFQTQIPLNKYLELDGSIQHNQLLLCIEYYQCRFISKRIKFYTYRDGERVKVMHYKVEMLDNQLFKKGTIKECFDNELSVPVMVNVVEPFIVKTKK